MVIKYQNTLVEVVAVVHMDVEAPHGRYGQVLGSHLHHLVLPDHGLATGVLVPDGDARCCHAVHALPGGWDSMHSLIL